MAPLPSRVADAFAAPGSLLFLPHVWCALTTVMDGSFIRWRAHTGKSWKRMVRKVTFVGDNFTRKPPKYERFIRPAALRFKVRRHSL